MEQNALLQLSHISKRYKTQLALKDISMTLRKGEILGFLGPSGAGKTTTIILPDSFGQRAGKQKFWEPIRPIWMRQSMKKSALFPITAVSMKR